MRQIGIKESIPLREQRINSSQLNQEVVVPAVCGSGGGIEFLIGE